MRGMFRTARPLLENGGNPQPTLFIIYFLILFYEYEYEGGDPFNLPPLTKVKSNSKMYF